MVISLLATFLFLTGGNYISLAQFGTKVDIEDSALKYAISLYEFEQGRNSLIYTGKGYYDPHDGIIGHQFFMEDYWEPGHVTYDQSTYDSIYLKYDIYKDILLVENFNSQGYLSPIKLFSENVQGFEIFGYEFVRLEKDTISGLRGGFYNLMYSADELQVLVRRRKEIIQSNEINSIKKEFVRKDRHYIKKDGMYHRIRKKKSVLKVLYDHKKEVKSYIRQNNLLFKVNLDLQLVQVVKYYSSLI